jgi:hypothetical protein
MLVFFTVFMMILIAYVFLHEGVLTAFTMMCNVFLAGLIAFNWFEPMANELEFWLRGTFLEDYEDAFCLVGLFAAALGLLRWVTNQLADQHVEYHPYVLQGGAVLFGLFTGYLLAGFLICVFQTMPCADTFAGFDYKADMNSPTQKVRRVMPPDRVWLALMHRAGSLPLRTSGPTFDPDGDFELRYARFRRFPAPP